MVAAAVDAIRATVESAEAVVAVGASTHAEIGGAVTAAAEVRAPAGIVAFEPADMTVTVLAGTTFAELDAALAEQGQECPLDPRDPAATVGGILSTGLSGLRRLGLGPVRDTLLEVVFVTAAGRYVKGGGPTVKNVTGYDIPRLFVGSLGTLGVLTRVTLRTRPRPTASIWFSTEIAGANVRTLLFAPTTVASDGRTTRVCLEGNAHDIATQAAAAGLTPGPAPAPPAGEHRGRVSVDPTRLADLESSLRLIGSVTWLAEYGVGTVHVATGNAGALADVRTTAEDCGGWMLRESGAPDLDPFGAAFPATPLQRRIRTALDPTGKLSPGRVPATEVAS